MVVLAFLLFTGSQSHTDSDTNIRAVPPEPLNLTGKGLRGLLNTNVRMYCRYSVSWQKSCRESQKAEGLLEMKHW